MMIGEIVTDKIIEEITIEATTGKIMDYREHRYRSRDRSVSGCRDNHRSNYRDKSWKDLSKVEIQAEIGIGKDSHDHNLEQNQKIEDKVIDQGQSQGLDLVQE